MSHAMSEALPGFLEPEFLKKLEHLRLVAKRLSRSIPKGEHPSSLRGFSLEFSDYRRYQKGDDLRYVDWNIYRRLGRLWLKLFTAEEEMNIYLLLDASQSMAEGRPAKIEYAKRVAAALGYIGLKNLDRVGGASFSADFFSPLALGRGRNQILTLFQFLENLSCQGKTDLGASAQAFAGLFSRPGLAVLLSDLFDLQGWRAALEELVRKKYQVLVIHILDRSELEHGPMGDVLFADVESQKERRVFLDKDLARRFQEELQSYFGEIEGFCLSRRMDYFRTTTATPFEDFVLLTLRHAHSIK
ncbi:MAG: DUF58 domain-containing protein [Deltaproteobacteria bacterium]|nr:DUF58 domain-containing protein [Deltaproteobacteria bacterium]